MTPLIWFWFGVTFFLVPLLWYLYRYTQLSKEPVPKKNAPLTAVVCSWLGLSVLLAMLAERMVVAHVAYKFPAMSMVIGGVVSAFVVFFLVALIHKSA